MVTGHDAEAVERGLVVPALGRFVRNERYREGQATSLAAALHELADESEAAVVLMADQPGVTAEDVRALIEAFRPNARRSCACGTRTVRDRRCSPARSTPRPATSTATWARGC